MKTTLNTKPFTRPFLAFVCCLFLFQAAIAQNPITLTFSGKDATSGNPVPLQSVMVSNITQGGDTTLWGDTPSLVLQESYGIFEMNHSQNASFTLEPNFPNPFAGTTTVSIRLEDRQDLTLTLYDQQGAVAAMLELELGRGTHRFEVAVPQNRLCLLSVSDGLATETLKLFSITGNDYGIDYKGPDETSQLKTGNETTAFVFQPGDMLEFTVNAVGYYEYTSYDNPTENTPYVFELQVNTTQLPPTVTTAAVTNITATTATSGGNVSDEGSATVTARGVCWSTAPNPTTANNFTNDGGGTGAFTSSITGLAESSTYYVRAYATNQFGTAYGNEVSYSTTALEPVYVCDSAITYSNYYGTEKVIFTYNASGQRLKELYKILNTSYGVWVNYTQYLSTYDASGNILSKINQDWNSTIGSWVNNSQYLYTYDASGNMLSYTYQNWNSTIGSWVNIYQYLYTYDASGNRLSKINQDWNSTIGSWVNNSQYLYTYNASGNMLSYTYQNWNSTIGSWVNNWQELYTYNASGNMLSWIYQNWNSTIGSWVNIYQYLYTYDSSGNRLSDTYQNWNSTIGSWVNNSQYLYTYDASGNMLSYTYQNWNSTIGSWVNDSQALYTYNASGNRLSKIKQDWNSTIGSWVNDYQYLYTYDASGNLLLETHQDWNSTIGSWVNYSQGLYAYDASGNMLSLIYQDWNTNIGSWVNYSQYLYTYDASGYLLSYIYQDWNTSYGTWANVWKHEYTYDYPTKKITWMYYVWSGGWVSEYYNGNFDFYLKNNWLWYGDYCNKIEVWWDEYPSVANQEMILQEGKRQLPSLTFTHGNRPEPGLFEESTRADGKDLPGMHQRKDRHEKPNMENPSFNRPERQMNEQRPVFETKSKQQYDKPIKE
ncbi:MAG: hypothetical protein K9H16_00835 [Bacteroidales bacterium]|nr:hypothetical protein [Bacteroidales bacterium]